jgi:hypothetical protein
MQVLNAPFSGCAICFEAQTRFCIPLIIRPETSASKTGRKRKIDTYEPALNHFK